MNALIKIIFLFFKVFFIYFLNYFSDFILNLFNVVKISVIIPVYNSENYLEECLNSVIKQTLKNIEIICIDDGSTDNSSHILQMYSKFDNRFTLIKQKNKGSGISRNKGIEKSKGKYVSFLDSDDMYYNDFSLELLYNKANKNKAIICGGGLDKRRVIKNHIVSHKIFFKKEGFMNYID